MTMGPMAEVLEVDALREQLLEQQPESKALLDRLFARLGRSRDRGAFAPIRGRNCSACRITIASARLQRAKA